MHRSVSAIARVNELEVGQCVRPKDREHYAHKGGRNKRCHDSWDLLEEEARAKSKNGSEDSHKANSGHKSTDKCRQI